jgi:hypothetical protein
MYSRQKNVKGAINCYEKDLDLITHPIHNPAYTVISDNTTERNSSDSVRTDVSTDGIDISNSTNSTDKVDVNKPSLEGILQDTNPPIPGTSNSLTPSEKLKITSIHLKLGSLYSSPPLLDVISAAGHYDTALDMGAEMDKNLRIFYAKNSKILYENSLKIEGIVASNNDGDNIKNISAGNVRNGSEIDRRGLDGGKKMNESLMAQAQRMFLGKL